MNDFVAKVVIGQEKVGEAVVEIGSNAAPSYALIRKAVWMGKRFAHSETFGRQISLHRLVPPWIVRRNAIAEMRNENGNDSPAEKLEQRRELERGSSPDLCLEYRLPMLGETQLRSIHVRAIAARVRSQ
jgi:hypothetical protein